jgi:hypothetical protein
MKIRKFNFFSTIYVILTLVILAALLTALNSCELVNLNALRPDDLVYSGDDTVNQDTINQDSIIVDTTVIVVDTPCIDPVEQTSPAFVTLYVEFDILEDSIRWQGGQVESYDIRDVIEAVTANPYTVYHSGKSWAVIIDNTNDNQAFYLKVFARSNGAKVYMGAIKQGFIFAGALTFDQFRAAAIKYPSVDRFNFRNTQFDSIQYVQLADIIIGDCKEGRTWADFRFNPFEMDPAIITEFENAGWQTVLH